MFTYFTALMKGKINTEKENIYRLIAFFFRICYYAAHFFSNNRVFIYSMTSHKHQARELLFIKVVIDI